jgi:hypothetical protein
MPLKNAAPLKTKAKQNKKTDRATPTHRACCCHGQRSTVLGQSRVK